MENNHLHRTEVASNGVEIPQTQEPIPNSTEGITVKIAGQTAAGASTLVLLVLVVIFFVFEYPSATLPVQADSEVASVATAANAIFSDVALDAKGAIVVDLKNNKDP